MIELRHKPESRRKIKRQSLAFLSTMGEQVAEWPGSPIVVDVGVIDVARCTDEIMVSIS